MRYPFTPVRLDFIKKTQTSARQDVEDVGDVGGITDPRALLVRMPARVASVESHVQGPQKN